ncbi:hypothetical protein [Enterococcus mundtii]|uniref:hypothetical protein n=1 Tax=Enterococcus TaxID=1350 RepID=UPI0015934373|nr:hypothetical protein [Enterococcus mundtii]
MEVILLRINRSRKKRLQKRSSQFKETKIYLADYSAISCFSPPNDIKWRRKEVDGGERI